MATPMVSRGDRFGSGGSGFVPAVLVAFLVAGYVQGQPAQVDPPSAPVEPAAIESPRIERVPDDENAWLIFLKAAQAGQTGVDSPASSNLEYPAYPPFGDKWQEMAAASEAAHGEAFHLARQARSLPRSMVRSKIPASPEDLGMTQYNPIRHLANLLGDSAMHNHLEGDDAEAIGRLLDLLHLAKSMRADPILLSQLVALGMDSVATSRAQTIAPGLRFDPQQTDNPTSPQQVRRLIDALLDDDNIQERMRQTLHVEHSLIFLWKDDQPDRQPLTDQHRDLLAASRAVAIDALNRGNLPNTMARLKDRPVTDPGVDERLFITYYRNIAERRMTAISLAAQLYRADHDRWPEQLDQLVPEYLPQVPPDPFRNDGQPIGYVLLQDTLPDGSDRPLLYIDSGPAEDAIDTEPMYGWQYDPRVHKGQPRRTEYRQYRDLSRWLPQNRRFDQASE